GDRVARGTETNGARPVGGDQVALHDIADACEEDVLGVVAADDVAGPGTWRCRQAADERVRRVVGFDALQARTECGGPGGVGADVVAPDLVAVGTRALDEDVCDRIRADDVSGGRRRAPGGVVRRPTPSKAARAALAECPRP